MEEKKDISKAIHFFKQCVKKHIRESHLVNEAFLE